MAAKNLSRVIGILKVLSCFAYLVGLWAACYFAPWRSIAEDKYLDGEAISAPLWAASYESRHINANDREAKQKAIDAKAGKTQTITLKQIDFAPGTIIAAKCPVIVLNTSLFVLRLGMLSAAFGAILLLLHYIASCFCLSSAPTALSSDQ